MLFSHEIIESHISVQKQKSFGAVPGYFIAPERGASVSEEKAHSYMFKFITI